MKRILLVLLCLMMSLTAIAEAPAQYESPEAEIAALQARIDELEAIVANLEERLSQYEPVLSVTSDPDAAAIEFKGGSVSVRTAQAAFDEMAVLYEEFGLSRSEFADSVKADVLANLAEEAILTIKAQELNVYESTAEERAAAEFEAAEAYESALNYYIPFFEGEGLSEEDQRAQAEAYIHSEGITYEYLLESVLQEQWHERLFNTVTADITVTDEDIRAMYDNGLAAAKKYYEDPTVYEYDYVSAEIIYTNPEGYREVTYIGLSYNDEELAMEPAERMTSIGERYADVISRAAAGENMTTLAEEFLLFDCGTLPVGENSTLMPAEFNAAALQLQLNETSAPIAGETCAWIIRHTAEIIPGDVSFDTLYPVLVEAAAATARQDAYTMMVDQWLAEAEIVTHPDRIQ